MGFLELEKLRDEVAKSILNRLRADIHTVLRYSI